jgi:proline iminopeptidase
VDEHVLADDGCRLWASVPDDASLVFCHGGPGLWDYFADLAAMLPAVRWDQRGCGRSDRRGPYTVDRFVTDLDAVRAATGRERVDLLGHSWGATLALRYTLAHPERVGRLIYVAGTGIDPDETWRPEFHANLASRVEPATPGESERDWAVRQWTADFADPSTARDRAGRMAEPWYGIAHECADAIKAEMRGYLRTTDVAALCRALEVPTVIVDGGLDLRPRWAVDSLHAALPHSRRVILPGVGHIPWADDPDAFLTALPESRRRPAPRTRD